VKVIISLSRKKLKHYLEKSSEKHHYIYFGKKEKDIVELLNKTQNLREIKIDKYGQKFKDGFVESYIDLIGRLGRKYNSIYWWVTNTSAKNQFGSKFLENLFLFYIIVNEIKKIQTKQKENIMVIEPPRAVLKSLKKYCFKNSVEVKILSSNYHNFLEILKNASKYIKDTGFFIYSTWKKIYLSNKYLKKKFNEKVQQNDKYYVLKTWFYSRSINEDYKYHDSFFGVLPEYLVKKGKKLLILTGIIGDYKSNIEKIAKNNEYFFITQEFFAKYTDVVRCLIDVYFNKIKIIEKVDFEGLDVSDILRLEVGREFTGYQLLEEYMYSYYMRRLLDNISIDTFTTTYENHPWEKVYFLTIKKYSPQTKIIGYQHAALSKAFIDMVLSKYEKEIIPLPDKIVTTGKITKDFLETYGNYEKDKIKEGCALRIETISETKMEPRKLNCKILLILGGVAPYDMVNFIYRGIKDNEQYKIIIRTHPALPLERFTHKLEFDIFAMNNFSISSNISVKKDIQEADILVYHASTISLEALMMGIPVIHIDFNDILSFDPLIGCDSFKWIVTKDGDFIKTLENIYQLSDDEYYDQQLKARKYAENYVYNITNERLDEFL